METDPLIGRTLGNGRYEITAVLGQGGMGKVYAALQRDIGRRVVVKLIHAHLVSHPHILERLRREMQLMAKVEHPNTVRLYDWGEESGQPFLVMEFLRGRTLRDILHSEGPLATRRIVALGAQIARGLRAIHAAGVVHRDLKPDNIMVIAHEGEPESAKILDFGVARPLTPDSSMTQQGMLVGTPLYMSPEQVMGGAVDARSDLYALGVVLYEMANGTPPFLGETPVLLHAHMQNEPAPLRFSEVDSPPLRELVMQLLSKAPERRPESAIKVVHELERIAALSTRELSDMSGLTGTFVGPKTDPIQAPPPVPSEPASPSLQVGSSKPTRPTWAVASVLIVLAGALGWLLTRSPIAETPSADSENARGVALARAGHLAEAEAAYRHALLISPAAESPRFNLGLLALRRSDAQEALRAFETIARENPDHPAVWLVQAEAHRQLGQRAQARHDLEQHTERHPNDATGWLHLGRMRSADGDASAHDAFCRARDLGNAEAASGCLR